MGLSGWCGVGWHGVGCDAWGGVVRWIGFRRVGMGWVMGDVVGLEELKWDVMGRQLAQYSLQFEALGFKDNSTLSNLKH